MLCIFNFFLPFFHFTIYLISLIYDDLFFQFNDFLKKEKPSFIWHSLYKHPLIPSSVLYVSIVWEFEDY